MNFESELHKELFYMFICEFMEWRILEGGEWIFESRETLANRLLPLFPCENCPVEKSYSVPEAVARLRDAFSANWCEDALLKISITPKAFDILFRETIEHQRMGNGYFTSSFHPSDIFGFRLYGVKIEPLTIKEE